MVSHSLNSLKEYCDVALFLGRDNVVHYFDNVENAIKNIWKKKSFRSKNGHSQMLTAIIPIDLKRRSKDLIEKR